MSALCSLTARTVHDHTDRRARPGRHGVVVVMVGDIYGPPDRQKALREMETEPVRRHVDRPVAFILRDVCAGGQWDDVRLCRGHRRHGTLRRLQFGQGLRGAKGTWMVIGQQPDGRGDLARSGETYTRSGSRRVTRSVHRLAADGSVWQNVTTGLSQTRYTTACRPHRVRRAEQCLHDHRERGPRQRYRREEAGSGRHAVDAAERVRLPFGDESCEWSALDALHPLVGASPTVSTAARRCLKRGPREDSVGIERRGGGLSIGAGRSL